VRKHSDFDVPKFYRNFEKWPDFNAACLRIGNNYGLAGVYPCTPPQCT